MTTAPWALSFFKLMTRESQSVALRRYEPADLEAIFEICVRTAAAGADARGIYSDERLMGNLFAAPYVFLEPELAYVADAAGEAVGYVVGTHDTPSFVRRYREEWIPRLADRYPESIVDPATPDGAMLALHYDPERMLIPELSEYPAHMHVDLLPMCQQRGYGSALVERFIGAAGARGARAVHVGMLTANKSARIFYDRLSAFTRSPWPTLVS
jgi:GNAT superfamily N-acetyltransferase